MTPEILEIRKRREILTNLERETREARALYQAIGEELAAPVTLLELGAEGVRARIGGRLAGVELQKWLEGYIATLTPKVARARAELETAINAWQAKSTRFQQTARGYWEQIITLRKQLDSNPQARQALEGQIAEMEKKYHATERQAQEFLNGGIPDSFTTV